MANNNDDDVPFMQKLLDNHFLLLRSEEHTSELQSQR